MLILQNENSDLKSVQVAQNAPIELEFEEQEDERKETNQAQDDLEKKLLDLKNENVVLRQEIEAVKQKARAMLIEKDLDIDKLKHVSQVQPSTTDQQLKRVESVDVDYLRNILIKYLEYIATGEEKEAMTLEKVLFTVVNANSKELENLQRARQRNNTGLLSYFYTPA